MYLDKEKRQGLNNEKGLKIQIFSDDLCKIEAKCKDPVLNTMVSKNTNEEYTSENVNSGSLDFSKTATNMSFQTVRVSKNSLGNSIVNFAASNNIYDSSNNLTKLSSLFQNYSTNKQEIDMDNILIDDDTSNKSRNSSHCKSCKKTPREIIEDVPNQNDISSSSIIHVNAGKKSEISNHSIFYTPSTICNYYQASNEVTPNKNLCFFDTANTFKLNLRNLNLVNINNNNSNSNNGQCNTSHSNYEENITENNEYVNSSSRNTINNLDRKTPIKYVKSQLKSSEKENHSTSNNRSNINNRSSSSRGAPSPFVNIFKINSKTVDGSLSAIAKEIKKTFNISELEIDEKILNESSNDVKEATPTLDRRNLNSTFNQIKDINNNIPINNEEQKVNSAIYEKVVLIKAPSKNENFSFDITHEQKINNLAEINNTNTNVISPNVSNLNVCKQPNNSNLSNNLISTKEELINRMTSNLMKYNIHPDLKSLLKKNNKSKPENQLNADKRNSKFSDDYYSIHEKRNKINSADRNNYINVTNNYNATHTTQSTHGTNPTITTLPTQSTNEKTYSNKLSPKLSTVNRNLLTTQPSSNKSKNSSSKKKLNIIHAIEDLSDFDLKTAPGNPNKKINMNISNSININKIVIQPKNVISLQNVNEGINSPTSNLVHGLNSTTINNSSKISSLEKRTNPIITEPSANSKNRKFLELFKLYSCKPNPAATPIFTKKKFNSNSANRCNTFLSYNSKARSMSRGSSGNKVIEVSVQMDQKSHASSQANQNSFVNKIIPKLNTKIINKPNKQNISPSSHRSGIGNNRNVSNTNVSNMSNISNISNSYKNTLKYLDHSKQNLTQLGNTSHSSIKTTDFKHRINTDISKNLADDSNKNSVVSILKKNPKVINNFSNYKKTKITSMVTNLSPSSNLNSNKENHKKDINTRESSHDVILNKNNIKKSSSLTLNNIIPAANVVNFTISNNVKKAEIKKQVVSSKINFLIGDEDSVLIDD